MIKIENDIKGLIFDCDGTLVDSMPLHWDAWQETFKQFGLECPTSYLESHAGAPIMQTLKSYMNDFKIQQKIDLDEFVSIKHAKSIEMLQDVKPIQEVVDVVLQYHGILPMAVASGGSRKNVLISLESIKVTDFFDTIITADDTIPGKPNPDIFLVAAKRMGVNPANCLVFEDGTMGILAAQRAGMRCFDVNTL